MSFVRSLALIGALIAAVSCSSPTSPTNDIPTTGAAAYFPAETGMTWIYEYEILGSDVTRLDTSTVLSVDGTVARIRNWNGNEALYDVTDEAVQHLEPDTGEPIDDSYAIKMPLTSGETWGSDLTIYTIDNADTSITTPAGTFADVLAVRFSITGMATPAIVSYRVDYYAKDVGLVKTESYGWLPAQRALLKVEP